MRNLIIIILVGSIGLGACASGPGGGGQGASRDLISSQQLRDADTSAQTLDQVIQRLRPWWLQPRSTTILAERILPVVYMDGSRLGEVELLASIPVHEVEEVRFLSAGDATTRYGTGHAGGVIYVESRR